MTKTTRVLLAECQPIIRNILQQELSNEKYIEVVETIETKVSLLYYLNNTNQLPDVILLDAALDVEENFTLTQHISKQFPSVAIIATINAMDTLYIRRMIQSGIEGFVLKESDIVTIKEAIDAVLNGDNYFASPIINFKPSKQKRPSKRNEIKSEILNSVEQEILKLVVNQYSTKEISNELALELQEVNAVIDVIGKKTNATTPVSLQKYAFSRKLY